MASGWTLEDLDEATLAAELSNMAGLNNELVNTPTTAYNMRLDKATAGQLRPDKRR